MRAFHGQQRLKDDYLARVRAHRAADELIHGEYWSHGKGCAVGCTVHSANHGAYETALGIPRRLARLEDSIFEALSPPEDLAWPEAFLEAIPVGADLSLVWPQFALRLLADKPHGVLRYVQQPQHTQQRLAIEQVVNYYQQWVDAKEQPTAATTTYAVYDINAADAAVYAINAAAYAADAAVYAINAAAYAADAAAVYAIYASADAAAVYAIDAAAARKAAWRWQGDLLLVLLRQAPVPAVVS